MSPNVDTPFRICVLGDFSGRENRQVCISSDEVARLQSVQIDRDNFESVMQRCGIRLERLLLPSEGESVSLTVESMEHFEPDYLFQGLDVFAKLRELRDRLLDDSTFASAAEEIQSWANVTIDEPNTPSQAEPQTRASESLDVADQGGDFLDQVLDASASQQHDATAEWKRMIQEIAAPYSVAGSDPRQKELLACVDSAIQATMTSLLHQHFYRALESAWRSLHMLVHQLETSPELQVHLVDVSRNELQQDLFSTDQLAETGLYRLLVENTVQTPGADPWTLLVGNFEFGATDDEAALLGRIAKISAAAGATLLTAASNSQTWEPAKVENPDLNALPIAQNETWVSLRKLPETACLGLIWPRYLVRLPYGPETKPVEEFPYQEMEVPESERLLWGNPAFLCATLLGDLFAHSGWDMDIGAPNRLSGLPLWVYSLDGETVIHPCGQCLLTDRLSEALMSQGLITVRSIRDEDSIQLGPLVSFHGTRLLGRWDA